MSFLGLPNDFSPPISLSLKHNSPVKAQTLRKLNLFLLHPLFFCIYFVSSHFEISYQATSTSRDTRHACAIMCFCVTLTNEPAMNHFIQEDFSVEYKLVTKIVLAIFSYMRNRTFTNTEKKRYLRLHKPQIFSIPNISHAVYRGLSSLIYSIQIRRLKQRPFFVVGTGTCIEASYYFYLQTCSVFYLWICLELSLLNFWQRGKGLSFLSMNV